MAQAFRRLADIRGRTKEPLSPASHTGQEVDIDDSRRSGDTNKPPVLARCFRFVRNPRNIRIAPAFHDACPKPTRHDPTRPAQPNLVLCVMDDHQFDALGFLGHPMAKTPFLDELAASYIGEHPVERPFFPFGGPDGTASSACTTSAAGCRTRCTPPCSDWPRVPPKNRCRPYRLGPVTCPAIPARGSLPPDCCGRGCATRLDKRSMSHRPPFGARRPPNRDAMWG